MRVIYDQNCLETGKERLFPISKHRSKRIHKKLLKRFGGEFRKVPCMYKVGGTIVAHPSYRARIEASIPAFEQRNQLLGIFGPPGRF